MTSKVLGEITSTVRRRRLGMNKSSHPTLYDDVITYAGIEINHC